MSRAQDLETLRQKLCELGDAIRVSISIEQGAELANLRSVSEVTQADVIYQVDKTSEDAIIRWFETRWPSDLPVQIVMEGIDDDNILTFPIGMAIHDTLYKLILDPIDGTRGIMYDKRSAWALAGLAPQMGEDTRLSDIIVAAMTELPTSKQGYATQLSAIKGLGRSGVVCESIDLATDNRTRIQPRPSEATDLQHGFASVVKFFPSAKTALAAFEEELIQSSLGKDKANAALVFDDQYISTGGQLYELLCGHDRATIDIRPLAYSKLGLDASLSCHPYDLASALIATEIGVVVECPDGSPIQCPLDTTTPVSWVAYANETLASTMRPLVRNLTIKHFGQT